MVKTTTIPELTDEQFDKLTEYVWVFNKAKNNYVTGFTKSVADDIFGVYEELGFRIRNRNCTSCVIDALKRLAIVYDTAYEKRNTGISVEDKPTTKKTKKRYEKNQGGETRNG